MGSARVDLSLTSNRGYEHGRPLVVRALWMWAEALVLLNPFVTSYPLKRWLLRRFGATVGPNVIIKPGVHVKHPWRLEIGANAWIGERAWIDNLAVVRIGANACISQGAYLCTGNHDWSDPGMGLVVAPIEVEPGAWVGAFAKVAPGVTVREQAVLGLGCAGALVLTLAAAGCGSAGEELHTIQAPRNTETVHWEMPSGNPIGVVILLPGGGFQRPTALNYRRGIETSKNVAAGGVATVVVRYRAGPEGLSDVVKVYKQARRRFRSLPICAFGGSAGGAWALMLAAREPGLACVVDLAGPTDLTSVGAQGSAEGQQLADAAFTPAEQRKFSPINHADRIKARVLAVYAENDPVVPVAQADELARALPSAQIVKLPPGPSYFIHSGVDTASLGSIVEREQTFLRAAMQHAASG